MTCIKTGCQIFIAPYQEFAYGDAFRVGNVYVFRLCERGFAHITGPLKHFTIDNWVYWFDDAKTSQATNSTLIAEASDVEDHGYDGIQTAAAPGRAGQHQY